MGSIGAARSILRSTSIRNATKNLAGEAKAAPFRLPGKSAASAPPRFLLRSPVEMSFCVESLLPMHSATASSLMTSMLSVSLRGYGWLSEAGIADV